MAGYFCNRQVNRSTSESSLHNHDVEMKLQKYEIQTIGEGSVKQFQTIDTGRIIINENRINSLFTWFTIVRCGPSYRS